MSNNRQKNYYSLNLTEGRIFIIFISFIILLVVVIFGFLIIISNQNKSDDINLKVEGEDFKEMKDSDFVFYSDLTGEPESNINIDLEDNLLNSEINIVENKVPDKIAKEDDFEIVLKEKKEEHKLIVQKADNRKNLVKLDNSDVLYSSTFDNKIEIKKSENNVTSFNKTISYSNKTNTSTVPNKRYIVQIGSYLSKDTANDISSYYRGQGYPAYIRSKDSEGKTYYRLRIGPFKEKGKAEEYLTTLKSSKYGKNCYISVVYL